MALTIQERLAQLKAGKEAPVSVANVVPIPPQVTTSVIPPIVTTPATAKSPVVATIKPSLADRLAGLVKKEQASGNIVKTSPVKLAPRMNVETSSERRDRLTQQTNEEHSQAQVVAMPLYKLNNFLETIYNMGAEDGESGCAYFDYEDIRKCGSDILPLLEQAITNPRLEELDSQITALNNTIKDYQDIEAKMNALAVRLNDVGA